MLLLTLFVGGTVPAAVAQQRSTDSESIQQRLEEEGLDEAPDIVEVEDIEYSGQEPSSGFVDENGNPLSDEEYAEWREENEKGFLRKNPWVLPVVLVLVTAGAFAAMKRKK